MMSVVSKMRDVIEDEVEVGDPVQNCLSGNGVASGRKQKKTKMVKLKNSKSATKRSTIQSHLISGNPESLRIAILNSYRPLDPLRQLTGTKDTQHLTELEFVHATICALQRHARNPGHGKAEWYIPPAHIPLARTTSPGFGGISPSLASESLFHQDEYKNTNVLGSHRVDLLWCWRGKSNRTDRKSDGKVPADTKEIKKKKKKKNVFIFEMKSAPMAVIASEVDARLVEAGIVNVKETERDLHRDIRKIQSLTADELGACFIVPYGMSAKSRMQIDAYLAHVERIQTRFNATQLVKQKHPIMDDATIILCTGIVVVGNSRWRITPL